MNKQAIAELLEGRSQTQEYKDGSREQQMAAVKTASLINTQDIETMPVEVVADVIYALNTDVQVRDYLMGLMHLSDAPMTYFRDQLELISDIAPEGYKSAPTTLLALSYYQLNDAETANKYISEVDYSYSLATLLRRVFGSGWPAEAFKTMATELHPKVVAGIFGDSDDNSAE